MRTAWSATTKRIFVTTTLATLLAAGCEGPQNYLVAGSASARGIASYGWFVLLLFSAVTLLVWLMLWGIALRRHGSFDEHAPVDTDDGKNWILIGGLAIPSAVFLLVFVLMLRPMHAFPMHHSDGQPDMRVIGKQWWFNAQYMFERPELGIDSPTEIHIPAGRAVEIELETRDVIHSFWIPKLHGKVDLVPGRANVLQLQADRPGIYEGECAEFCGVQHAHMRLQVIAQPPAEYAGWVEAQRQPAATPHDPLAARGSEVF
jgi:cytochrome c oxidase subunit 2